MTLTNITKPEDAISEIKDELLKIEQSIARFDMNNALECANRIEGLCSFLYTYWIKARQKQKEGIRLGATDYHLFAIDFDMLMKFQIPTLKNVIEREFEPLNEFERPIRNIKNVKQKAIMNSFWNLIKALKIETAEIGEKKDMETLWSKVSIR
jgi:hypothetical protein